MGCRKRATKSELLRVVVGSADDGPAVVPDLRGTTPGRGAYLHRTVACYELAHRRRAFTRALRLDQGLATDAVRALLESLDT
ncbi:YlxR family protein [Nocardioides dubius]|uniref:YlxR family protein n=1 Tax=Nocardioides dubius TaxID=317019 RepID=UPI0031E3A1E5